MSANNANGFWAGLRRGAIVVGQQASALARWSAARLAALYRWQSPRLRAAWIRSKEVAGTRWKALVRAWDHGAPLKRAMRPIWKLTRIVTFAAVGTALLWATQALWISTIPTGHVGVRQVVWGDDKGVVEMDHAPGFGFALAGRSSWHHVPSLTRAVVFAPREQGGTQPMLSISTKDGEPVELAVTVPYRVKPDRAHRLVADGLRQDFEARLMSTLRRVLPQEFSQLAASDWADPDARAAASQAALAALAAELDAIHLEPEAVLTGAVVFHPGYEKKMLEKQLQSHTRKTNESIAERARVQLELKNKERDLASIEARLVAQRDFEHEELRLELEEEALRLNRELGDHRSARRLEGDALVEGAKLDGELALREAQALGARLERELLATPGGRLHLAVAAAKNLRFGTVKLNSNDPRVPRLLDLDEMVTLLVGTNE